MSAKTPCRPLLCTVFLFLPFIVGAFAASAQPAPLSVTIVGDHLAIDGVQKGGSVAVLGAAHEHSYYMPHIRSYRELLTDDNGKGHIDYRPKGGVAFQSIWIVTDVATGQSVLAAPPGYRPIAMAPITPDGPAVQFTPTGVDLDREHADLMVVRPGEAAWSIAIRPGAGLVTAVANGHASVALEKLHPAGQTAAGPPGLLKKGDIVVIVDAVNLQYSITTFGRGGN